MPKTQTLQKYSIYLDNLADKYLKDQIIGNTTLNGKEYTVLKDNTLLRYCFVNGLQVIQFSDHKLPKDLIIDPLN